MQGLAQYIDKLSDLFSGVDSIYWIFPILGLLFIFLCIVSRGFRNFVLGIIILSILIFEGLWFYGRFYSTDEERVAFKERAQEFIKLAQKRKPTPTIAPPTPIPPTPIPPTPITPTPEPPIPTPMRSFLKDREL